MCCPGFLRREKRTDEACLYAADCARNDPKVIIPKSVNCFSFPEVCVILSTYTCEDD